jgi:hypothetical protein
MKQPYLSLLIFLFLGFTLTPTLKAKSYSAAVKAYKKNRFQICYQTSLQIARRGSKRARAKAYLMAGVCADKLDREQTSVKMFKRSLKLNPKISFPLFIRDKNIKLSFLDLKARFATNRASKNAQKEFRASDLSIYAPLGLNYFLNDYNSAALVHGGIQILAFAGAIDRFDRAMRVEKESASAEKAAKQTGTDQIPEYRAYKKSNDEYVAKMNEESLIFLSLGLISYGFSIWDVGTSDKNHKTDIDLSNSKTQNKWRQDLYLSQRPNHGSNYALTWRLSLSF